MDLKKLIETALEDDEVVITTMLQKNLIVEAVKDETDDYIIISNKTGQFLVQKQHIVQVELPRSSNRGFVSDKTMW